YYLGTGGPVLKSGGQSYVVGQAGGWIAIGAEAISGGYEVAWRDTASGMYTIWYTDSNGNFVSNQSGVVAGSSATLQNFENSFHQDLNNDGVVGPSAHTAPMAA